MSLNPIYLNKDKEGLALFKVADIYGIIAGMFVLILVYLMLSRSDALKSVLGTTFSGADSLARTLQGR